MYAVFIFDYSYGEVIAIEEATQQKKAGSTPKNIPVNNYMHVYNLILNFAYLRGNHLTAFFIIGIHSGGLFQWNVYCISQAIKKYGDA